ncbi:putative rhodopsin orphan GPCR [Fasciola hepatica]|uniref:Rhodopsin orphan GPCR n=1 Tax=Fasciola hepatica TaxID=6192 RepID=A0A4E0QXD7_FASHE|nr:putative rhodopsin orphan GPCR [Fasciola hepatica]
MTEVLTSLPDFSLTPWSDQLSRDLLDCFNCSLDISTDSVTVSGPNISNLPCAQTANRCSWTSCGSGGLLNVTNSAARSSSPGMTTWTSVQFSVLPILLLIIACVGLVGNALNLLVLYSYHTTQIASGGECTARVNLLGLALADFLVCLSSLPLGYVQRRHESYSFMLFYTIIGPGLVTYFLVVSVWMVLLMSVVRYMAVCRPLTSRAWLTPRHMFRVIVGIYLVGVIFHIPSFLMFTYENESALQKRNTIKCRPTNRTLTGPSTTSPTNLTEDCEISMAIFVFERPFWRSEAIYIGYHVIHIILTNIGPFIGVLISNIAVIRACRRSDACRRSFMESTSREVAMPGKINNSPPRYLFKAHLVNNNNININNSLNPNGIFLWNQQSVAPIRFSLQRYPNSATNRVTPLLLAVIIAFLLFTAPFGIVHFVCLQVMRKLGVRVRDNREARQLYTALNLTVEWTNVVQLLGCALNFFLYFLVSTIFRRTTKRTFRRLYKQLRTCRSELFTSLFSGKTSRSMYSWEQDTRTNELRRELEYKVVPDAYILNRGLPAITSLGPRSSRRSSSTTGSRITKFLHRRKKCKIPSSSLPTQFPRRCSVPSTSQPNLHSRTSAHSVYDPRLQPAPTMTAFTKSILSPPDRFQLEHSSLVSHRLHCDHSRVFHHSVPICNSCFSLPLSTSSSHHSARSEPQYCAVYHPCHPSLDLVKKSPMGERIVEGPTRSHDKPIERNHDGSGSFIFSSELNATQFGAQ